MTKFLKLSSKIINIKHINIISIKPNKYNINVMTSDSTGYLISGNGSMSSHDVSIEVCAVKKPIDYKTVSDWINKID